jgi:hypothetical protein
MLRADPHPGDGSGVDDHVVAIAVERGIIESGHGRR